MGNGVRKLIERALPSDVTADKFEKVYDLFKSHYFENCLIKTKPYDGIIPLLENLKKQNYKTAIVSNKYQDAVDEIKKLFFDNLIDTEVGESEHMPGKHPPDMVFKAVNDLKT